MQLTRWGAFTLTTHRVWLTTGDGLARGLRSVPIDAIESVGIEDHAHPVALVIAASLGLCGLTVRAAGTDDQAGLTLGFWLFAAAFAAIWATSRRRVVAIRAGATVLRAPLGDGIGAQQGALRFLDDVEAQTLAVRRTAAGALLT